MVEIVQLSSSTKSRKIRDFKPTSFPSKKMGLGHPVSSSLLKNQRVDKITRVRKLKLAIMKKTSELTALQNEIGERQRVLDLKQAELDSLKRELAMQ